MIGSGLVPATAGLCFTCSHLDLGLQSLLKPENAYQENLNLAMSCLPVCLSSSLETSSLSNALPFPPCLAKVNGAGPIMSCDHHPGRVAEFCRDKSGQVCPWQNCPHTGEENLIPMKRVVHNIGSNRSLSGVFKVTDISGSTGSWRKTLTVTRR